MDNSLQFRMRYLILKNGVQNRYGEVKNVALKPSAFPNKSDSNEITHGSYGGLLFDPRWKSKRTTILERDNFQCVICGNTVGLQIHHRQYHFINELQQFKPPWDYENRLLISLCESCHKRGHRQYKIPTINI